MLKSDYFRIEIAEAEKDAEDVVDAKIRLF